MESAVCFFCFSSEESISSTVLCEDDIPGAKLPDENPRQCIFSAKILIFESLCPDKYKCQMKRRNHGQLDHNHLLPVVLQPDLYRVLPGCRVLFSTTGVTCL